MVDTDPEEDGSQFQALLGGFGTHTDIERRKKAERLASMKPKDGRRRQATRTEQLNVRVDEDTMKLMRELLDKFGTRDKRKWSQADLMILAIGELAKAQKDKGVA